jgi:hypothetical protein
MRKNIILIFSLILLVGLFFTGCSKDESGPDLPEVQLNDQVVSIAMGNGNNTKHSGNDFLLDWNGDSAEDNTNPRGLQTIPVYHVAADTPTVENYYVLTDEDGEHTGADPHNLIDPIWDTVDWTTINLNPIDESVENYGDYTTYPNDTLGPHNDITQVRVKAIFNYQRHYIGFLFQWDDPSKDYKKDFWYCNDPEPNSGPTGYGDWTRNLDYDSDWIALMFSTWTRQEDGEGNLIGFQEVDLDFQTNGCTGTCHTDDRPYHINRTDEIADLWYWCASRSNYGDPTTLTELGGEALDGRINENGGVFGDINSTDILNYPEEYEGDRVEYGWAAYDIYFYNFLYDEGSPSHRKNSWRGIRGTALRGYYHYWLPTGNVDDPTKWFPYIWAPPAGIKTSYTYGSMSADYFPYEDVGWVVGSEVSGYTNRAAMGMCSGIRSTGVYYDGMWTVEIVRDLDTGDTDDVNLNIYEPAGEQE